MKNRVLLLSSLMLSTLSLAQVGINTEEPKSTLDVSAKYTDNILDNTQNYGLQAPRLTRAELTNLTSTYGDNQKGALIYITDITGGNALSQRVNITTVGYYYFDGSLWQPIRDTSIYKANGTISGENRIVYFNTSSSQNGKMIFTRANNGATISQTFLDERAPMFSLIGNDAVGNLRPEHGIFMVNGIFGNGMRKEAHLWSGAQNSSTSKVQFLAYSSLDGDILLGPPQESTTMGTTAYLGGKPFSKSSMVVDNIKLVVKNKKYRSIDANANETSTVPFKINGFASLISGNGSEYTDVWRPAVTIEDTDLYLKNLEIDNSNEVAGSVLTLVPNPENTALLKAVWRSPNSAPVTTNSAIVEFEGNYTLPTNTTATYFRYTGASNVNFTLPNPTSEQAAAIKQITIINTTDHYINFDGSGSTAPTWTTTAIFNRIGAGSRVTLMAVSTTEWIMLNATTGAINY